LAHSLVQTGNGKMMLKPVVHATGDVTSGAVNGTLTLPGGEPAAGSLTASSGDTIVATASADATGHYALPVLPAPAVYTFTATFTNAAGVVYTLSVPDVNVPANATTPEDLAFPPTGGLSGTITLAGQPLSNATVDARPAGQADATPVASATSDAAGAYVLPTLAPGEYDLTVSAAGAATGTDLGLTVTDGTLTTANLDLTAAP
ncbi:MAG TPA: carboxypeptidase-like regulatory domain-containing protein, partial [Deinococcales bacterium]|nr:carboxypeptidase-like regulatory domain-containing protein [Deinococcales bacterium]